MSVSPPIPLPVRHGPRAERTRGAVLAAAEALFAERGFASARLEDVARAVGVRRASLLYYFHDKEELYDAVLAELMQALHARVAVAVRADGTLAERVLRGVAAWIDFVEQRPGFARIVLREAADASPERAPRIARHAAPFYALAAEVIAATRPSTGFDPFELASHVAGSTLFFVAAMPVLAPALRFDPLAPQRWAAHRAEVMRTARRLLGEP